MHTQTTHTYISHFLGAYRLMHVSTRAHPHPHTIALWRVSMDILEQRQNVNPAHSHTEPFTKGQHLAYNRSEPKQYIYIFPSPT